VVCVGGVGEGAVAHGKEAEGAVHGPLGCGLQSCKMKASIAHQPGHETADGNDWWQRYMSCERRGEGRAPRRKGRELHRMARAAT